MAKYISFFTVVWHDSEDYLFIPKGWAEEFIVNQHRVREIPVEIFPEEGYPCNLMLTSKEDRFVFSNGWLKFMKLNGVERNDVVYFRLLSQSSTCLFKMSHYGPDLLPKNLRDIVPKLNTNVDVGVYDEVLLGHGVCFNEYGTNLDLPFNSVEEVYENGLKEMVGEVYGCNNYVDGYPETTGLLQDIYGGLAKELEGAGECGEAESSTLKCEGVVGDTDYTTDEIFAIVDANDAGYLNSMWSQAQNNHLEIEGGGSSFHVEEVKASDVWDYAKPEMIADKALVDIDDGLDQKVDFNPEYVEKVSESLIRLEKNTQTMVNDNLGVFNANDMIYNAICNGNPKLERNITHSYVHKVPLSSRFVEKCGLDKYEEVTLLNRSGFSFVAGLKFWCTKPIPYISGWNDFATVSEIKIGDSVTFVHIMDNVLGVL